MLKARNHEFTSETRFEAHVLPQAEFLDMDGAQQVARGHHRIAIGKVGQNVERPRPAGRRSAHHGLIIVDRAQDLHAGNIADPRSNSPVAVHTLPMSFDGRSKNPATPRRTTGRARSLGLAHD
jgi:hypothetical protein